MLKQYECVMRPLYNNYNNRYSYIKKLISERNPYLELFRDHTEVLQLVERQKAAHRECMTAEDGWQKAMMNAGIWDDGKENF